MRVWNRGFFAVGLLLALPMAAVAGSMDYTAYSFSGPDGMYTSNSATLPDLSKGGSVGFFGIYTVDPKYGVLDPYAGTNPTYVEAITNQPDRLSIGLPGDVGLALGTSQLSFEGTLSARLLYTPYGHRLGGEVSGTFTSAHWSTPDGQAPANAPPELLDLMTHPERLHLTGTAPGYIGGSLLVSLTLDPPSLDPPSAATPVPEPGMFVVFAIGFAVVGFCRRRRFSPPLTVPLSGD